MPDHDMKVGPCSCGAWHGEGEFKPMLTDEQIIRTLAEFEGKRVIELKVCRPIYDTRMGWWYSPADRREGGAELVLLEQVEGNDPRHGVFEHLPPYLTSYDALAPVCKKAWETVRVSTFGNAFRWWEMPPKALAEALATAILEAKEQS